MDETELLPSSVLSMECVSPMEPFLTGQLNTDAVVSVLSLLLFSSWFLRIPDMIKGMVY